MTCKCAGSGGVCTGCVYINPQRSRDSDSDTCFVIGAQHAVMQPNAAKLPRVHRTAFSVEDILDPAKFTRKRLSAEAAAVTGETKARGLRNTLLHLALRLYSCIYRGCVFCRGVCCQRWTQRAAAVSGSWKLQPRGGDPVPGEAPEVEGKKPTDPHRLHPGAAADTGAQLPKVSLPVGAGAAHHRVEPPPLRNPGQDLVSEQAHQVEEGACAGEGGRGGARPAPCSLLLSNLQHSSTVLPAAHSAPAVCTAAALSPLLHMMHQCALSDWASPHRGFNMWHC